jgi:hypothetical protein
VIPGVSGVSLQVYSEEEYDSKDDAVPLLELETDKEGNYVAGPLYDDVRVWGGGREEKEGGEGGRKGRKKEGGEGGKSMTAKMMRCPYRNWRPTRKGTMLLVLFMTMLAYGREEGGRRRREKKEGGEERRGEAEGRENNEGEGGEGREEREGREGREGERKERSSQFCSTW